MATTGKTEEQLYRDVSDYQRAWTEMMVKIWQTRLTKLRAIRTGALHRSVMNSTLDVKQDLTSTIAFRFVYYGVYVDAGTGRGYLRGNGGDLGLKHYRKRKRWMSVPWRISKRVLADKMVTIIGDAFVGMFDKLSE